MTVDAQCGTACSPVYMTLNVFGRRLKTYLFRLWSTSSGVLWHF